MNATILTRMDDTARELIAVAADPAATPEEQAHAADAFAAAHGTFPGLKFTELVRAARVFYIV